MTSVKYQHVVIGYVMGFSGLFSAVSAVFCLLPIYDFFLNKNQWGYPVWTVPVLIGFSILALFIRRASANALRSLKA